MMCGLVVHVGLEGELVLQRDRAAAAGRAEISSISRFTLGYFAKTSSPSTNGDQACPAPERHVDDGVGVADHVFALGEMIVEDLVMAHAPRTDSG